ncbi:hypothetical protein ACP6PL_16330, partial [Dapis sp. BLCC M126]|uniref:hypothetical protein n=1 Tax=Dapis sp. BLCC M126 TaxID=3400189 RepID=UPI003CF35B6C
LTRGNYQLSIINYQLMNLPLFLTTVSIAYWNISKLLEKIIFIFIILALCFSIFNNLRLSIN